MKKIKIIASAACMFFLGSCQRELDLTPAQGISTDVAVSTSEGIHNILLGAYALLGSGDMYGGDVQIYADLLGNTNQVYWYGTYADLRQIYNKNIISDNAYVRDTWKTAYQGIYQCNVILDHLSVITDQDDKNRVEGEAKFIRAINYFELVRNFGLQYQFGQNNSQLGVPLVLSSKINFEGDLSIARNTVEEVYTQILMDINDAITKLPTDNSYYADAYSARALAARIYLQMGDYVKARDFANDVIENSGRSLMSAYKDVFNSSKNTQEDLFAMQVTSQSGTNDLITFYADDAHGGRGGDIAINDDFLSLFDINDVRGSFYYLNGDDDKLTSKYTNQYGIIHVIRLAEMYLIRAEGNIRLGTTIGADPDTDINTLRSRAGADLVSSVGILDVLDERQRELSFEGFLVQDLKRTFGMIGGLNWNDNKVIFPIPIREMQVNPKLVQNPGYN